jgi:hypothetical protein
MVRPQVADRGTTSRYGSYLWIHWISSRGQSTRGGLGVGLTTTHHKNKPVTKHMTDSLDKWHKWWSKDIRLGTWNVKSVYKAGSLVTVSKELSKYRLHLVGMQEVRWDVGATEPAGGYTFFYGKGNENRELGIRHGASSACGWRNDLQLWRVAANILNKQPRTKDKGWSSRLGVGRGANNPSLQKN